MRTPEGFDQHCAAGWDVSDAADDGESRHCCILSSGRRQGARPDAAWRHKSALAFVAAHQVA